MTYFVTTGHPLGKYRYSVPTGYSRYGSYSSRLSDPSKGYTSTTSRYTTPYVSKSSYSSPYAIKSSYPSPYVSKYSSYTPSSYSSPSYKPTTYSRPSYLTSSKRFSPPRKSSLTYSEPRTNYSRTIKPLSSTHDHDYSYLKRSAPIELTKYPKSSYSSSSYSSNRQLVRPKMMPLSDVSFKWSLNRYRGHLADYLSWR